jgi:hypothetical protein
MALCPGDDNDTGVESRQWAGFLLLLTAKPEAGLSNQCDTDLAKSKPVLIASLVQKCLLLLAASKGVGKRGSRLLKYPMGENPR